MGLQLEVDIGEMREQCPYRGQPDSCSVQGSLRKLSNQVSGFEDLSIEDSQICATPEYRNCDIYNKLNKGCDL